MSDNDAFTGGKDPKDKPAPAAKSGNVSTDKREATAADGGGKLLTVDQWRDQLFPRAPSGAPHRDAWKHAAAAALHNWIAYAHHHDGPMTLSRADYEAALEAAQTVNDKGVSEPHKAAHHGDKQ